jgi:hypothetical protein
MKWEIYGLANQVLIMERYTTYEVLYTFFFYNIIDLMVEGGILHKRISMIIYIKIFFLQSSRLQEQSGPCMLKIKEDVIQVEVFQLQADICSGTFSTYCELTSSRYLLLPPLYLYASMWILLLRFIGVYS